MPISIDGNQRFGRGACGVTEPRCSRTQFSAQPVDGNCMLLTNLGSNRELPMQSFCSCQVTCMYMLTSCCQSAP